MNTLNAEAIANFLIDLSSGASQQQEVVAGAETRIFKKLVGRLAGPALEARLQRPYVAHIGRNPALQCQFLGLRIQHVVGS